MTSSSTTSVHNLPYWWRVTRYDPARRDERGAFPRQSWTSIADVGRIFDGVELTLEDYERIENAYLDAFVGFAEDAGVEQLQVRSLERGDGIDEGDIVSPEEARHIVRRLLREEVICKLEAPDNRFALHVGFDLYMYVGSMTPCRSAQRHAEELGLFVEPNVSSPLWVEHSG